MKKMLMLAFLCSLYTSCVSTVVDVSSGLSGTVIEAETNRPLVDCIVSISPGNQSVSTDDAGNFDFGTIDMGEYMLSVSCSSYKRYSQPIILKASETLQLTVEMQKATLPEISTSSYEDLTDRAVVLTGIIKTDGGVDLSEAGFYYGTTEKSNRKVLADVDGDRLIGYVSELSPSTKYYYRVYAKNELGEALGEVKSFVTEELQLSGVTTLDVSNVTSNSAIISATIPEGEDLVESCGFYVWTYGKYPDKYKAIYSKSYKCEIQNLVPGVRYYYKAFVANEKKENVGETKSFVAIRLEENGHEYVDLGLPSGTLWATQNLGADSEYDAGDYFAWAEIEPKISFSVDNYKYITKTVKEEYGRTVYYYEFNKYTPYDGLNKLDPSDDAASQIWGDSWRLPTDSQVKELLEKCLWKFMTIDDKEFCNVIGPNGAELLFPLTGIRKSVSGQDVTSDDTCYWTNCASNSSGDAMCLRLVATDAAIQLLDKYYGALIRPVINE